MKMLLGILICSVLDIISLSGQQRVQGKVVDVETNEAMIAVTVSLSGTGDGDVTDFEGEFDFTTNETFPLKISISAYGYDTQFVDVQDEKHFLVYLHRTLLLDEIQVTGVEDHSTSPNKREEMGATEMLQGAAPSVFQNMAHKNGIDVIGGISMPLINTRGFNSTSPVRMLQIIDGVDNQSPGLNFSLGNFLGASELDLQRMEVIVGASSPFYGPNAFNGVISMETKNPFFQQGTSAMVRAGERNLLEAGLRFAKVFKNKDSLDVWAFKVNLSALTADDWGARNYEPITDSKVSKDNPGRYDAPNIYGDEYSYLMDKTVLSGRYPLYGGLENFYRTGYKEEEVVDYHTNNYKASLAFHFRLLPKDSFNSPELILSSSFGSGTTIYQGDNRFSLRDILFFQHKIEWRSRDHFFLRAYYTHEDAGNSYDPYFTAIKLRDLAKADKLWEADYTQYWQDSILPIMEAMGYPNLCLQCPIQFDFDSAKTWLATHQSELQQWHSEVEIFANKAKTGTSSKDRLVPGTVDFENAFNDITSRYNNESGGTGFYDRSALFHTHGEYIFRPKFFSELRVGGNFRMYIPNSRGTIFSDTLGTRIHNTEVGFYTGVKKSLLKEDRLTTSATLRVDKNQNFKIVPTYAASLIYQLNKKTFWCFSASSALRNPTLSDQYLYLNVGPAILSGQVGGVNDLITPESFSSGIEMQDSTKFVYFDIPALRPEYVTTFETILRTRLGDRLNIELNYYRNRYKYFIGYLVGIVATFPPPPRIFLFPNYVQPYRYSANSSTPVVTEGFSIGMNYLLYSHFMLEGNYSFNKLTKSDKDDPIIPAYNTPLHKFNIGVSANDLKLTKTGLLQHFGFGIYYKWVDS
ncbi:MAG TPA: TonB-dependent receptor, partial [Saprospiraceae bacterium]|nr:TonB-dependent receptor [Saprospiraceae bacterium]